MDRILTYTIQPEQEGMQLLDFLRNKGFSRGILSSMKADKNAIQLNGERGFGKSVLQVGDSLHIHIPEADNTENILPVRMDLSILYEDCLLYTSCCSSGCCCNTCNYFQLHLRIVCADFIHKTLSLIHISSGNLKEIVALLLEKNRDVRIVINCITLETISEALEVLKEYDFADQEAVQLTASRSKEIGRYHLMMGENPIYIITCQSPRAQI